MKSDSQNEAEKTHPRRDHPTAARERRVGLEPGTVLPGEADLGGDTEPLAKEVWADGRGGRQAPEGPGEGEC